MGMLKKFLPDVNSPVAFGFSNDRNSDERMQRNRDNWTSDSSSDGNPDEQPSDDTTPLHPVESATSKTMAFPRRALSTAKPLTRKSSSHISTKKSSTARVTSSGRIIKTLSQKTSSSKKTVSVIRGAPLPKSSTRTMTSSTPKASSSRTSSLSQRVSSSSRLTKPVRGSKLTSSVASISTQKAVSSSSSRHTSSVKSSVTTQSACSARKGVTISLEPFDSSVSESSSANQKLSSSTNKASSSFKTPSDPTQSVSSAAKLAASSSPQQPQSSGRLMTEEGSGQESSFGTTRVSTKGNVPDLLSRPTSSTIPASRASSQPTIVSSSQNAASTPSRTTNAIRGSVLESSSVSTEAPSAVRGSLSKSLTAQDHSTSQSASLEAATTKSSSRVCRGMLSCPPEVSAQTSPTSAPLSSKQTLTSSAASHDLEPLSSIAGGDVAIKSDQTNPLRGQLPSRLSTLSALTTSLLSTSTGLSGSSGSSFIKSSAVRGQLPVLGSSSSRLTASSQGPQASQTSSSSHVSPSVVIGSGNLGEHSLHCLSSCQSVI